VDSIKQMPHPPKGDRKAARAANDAGLSALQLKAFDEAIEKFNQAIKADPADQEIVNNRGYALMMGGKLAEARSAFKDSLILALTRSSAWANLAMVFAKENKSDDGHAAYLLAFKFSQNQQKTREFLTKQSQEDADPLVRELAARVLQTIGPQ
jgi:Flp pilus assembly protein TadD